MTRTIVVAGVGHGLGESVARRFANEGCEVALFARSTDYLEDLADELSDTEGEGLAVPVDLSTEAEIDAAFATVRAAFGPVDVLVYNASAASWTGLLETEPADFDRALDVGPRGALACCQAAVPDMLDGDGGTVIFTGATTSVRGREGAIGFSASKFALRGMAESMARELGPEGIHVAHAVIDGAILTPETRAQLGDQPDHSFLDPDAIADAYWQLVHQDWTAWTLELDLRPAVEEF